MPKRHIDKDDISEYRFFNTESFDIFSADGTILKQMHADYIILRHGIMKICGLQVFRYVRFLNCDFIHVMTSFAARKTRLPGSI